MNSTENTIKISYLGIIAGFIIIISNSFPIFSLSLDLEPLIDDPFLYLTDYQLMLIVIGGLFIIIFSNRFLRYNQLSNLLHLIGILIVIIAVLDFIIGNGFRNIPLNIELSDLEIQTGMILIIIGFGFSIVNFFYQLLSEDDSKSEKKYQRRVKESNENFKTTKKEVSEIYEEFKYIGKEPNTAKNIVILIVLIVTLFLILILF